MLAQSTTLLLALGAVASAQTMKGFPSSITCLKDDGTNGTVSQAQIESAIVGPQGDLIEQSAANAASGHCVTLSIPLYNIVAGDIASVSYAYDNATDTYNFCLAQGATDPKLGYPTRCTEN
ncbi:hypothetical protein KVR01_008039 [Diaporthe batatas]|uniref:uncharacterized protein n=1 Tax=Diaporthe batatas TaxID=748121 RepID=UPI001D059865|nr:uncharacterized protein KVR01_008039 [Diaporthe batatas]KAG8162274.1 hypothetical protein KVR01_008039 [Diaporthe batatas]